MDWIQDYQLILFDFDGLLVNTEKLHFKAYKNMLAAHGLKLPWTFHDFCEIAHYSSDGLQKEIYRIFPQFKKMEPEWKLPYQEKKQAFLDLVDEGVELMNGARELITALHTRGVKMCVVTHSAKVLVDKIRLQNPILDIIPYWLTREDYSHAKPNPECYITAINRYAAPEDKIIGFEDAPRGLMALMETRAQPVIVCEISYPELPQFIKKGVVRLKSLHDLTTLRKI